MAPPVCEHLCLHNGRMYLSAGDTLWFTPPFWYDGVNKSTGFMSFSSRITMILNIEFGLVVGTEEEVILLKGMSPDDFEVKPLLKGRVIEDTGLVATGLTVRDKIVPGKTGMFTTQCGIYAVINSGELFDITGNRLLLPDAVSGNAYIADNFYTVLIDE